MLNRESEMKLLLEKFEEVKSEGGKVILLHGKSGVGKTTLIKEFSSKVPSKYFSVEYKSNPLEPFISYVGEKIFDEDLMRFLRSRLPPEVIKESLEKIILSTRVSAYQAIKEKLLDKEPLVIVVDDAENLGKESAHFILYLSRIISTMKVMLIIIVRSDFIKFSELREILPILHREGVIEEIEIKPLEEKYLVEIIKNEARESISEEYIKNLLEIASGDINMIKYMMRGELYKEEVIFSALQNKFYSMNPHPQKILKILSLIEIPINVEELCALTSDDIEKIADSVDVLLDNGWIVEEGEKIRVASGRVAAMIRKMISDYEKKTYHSIIAGFLEWKGRYALAALHHKLAGNNKKAFKLYLTAAELSIKRAGLGESMEYLKKAMEIKDVEKEDFTKALTLFGRVAILTSQPRLLDEYIDKFEDIPDHNSILAWYHISAGNFSLAEEYGKKCLREKDFEKLAVAHRILGIVNLHRGKLDDARNHLKKSYEFALKADDNDLKILALNDLGIVEMVSGNDNMAMELYKKAIGIDPDNRLALLPIFNLEEIMIDIGKLDEAERIIEDTLRKTDEKKYIVEYHYFLVSYGRIKLERGMFREASKLLEKAYNFFRKIKIPYIEAQILIEWGRVYLRMGDVINATRKFMEAHKISKDLNSDWLEEMSRCYISLAENKVPTNVKYSYIKDMINRDLKFIKGGEEN